MVNNPVETKYTHNTLTWHTVDRSNSNLLQSPKQIFSNVYRLAKLFGIDVVSSHHEYLAVAVKEDLEHYQAIWRMCSGSNKKQQSKR